MFPNSVMSGITRTHHTSIASSPEKMYIFPELSPTLSAPESVRASVEQLREVGLEVRMSGRAWYWLWVNCSY